MGLLLPPPPGAQGHWRTSASSNIASGKASEKSFQAPSAAARKKGRTQDCLTEIRLVARCALLTTGGSLLCNFQSYIQFTPWMILAQATRLLELQKFGRLACQQAAEGDASPERRRRGAVVPQERRVIGAPDLPHLNQSHASSFRCSSLSISNACALVAKPLQP